MKNTVKNCFEFGKRWSEFCNGMSNLSKQDFEEAKESYFSDIQVVENFSEEQKDFIEDFFSFFSFLKYENPDLYKQRTKETMTEYARLKNNIHTTYICHFLIELFIYGGSVYSALECGRRMTNLIEFSSYNELKNFLANI